MNISTSKEWPYPFMSELIWTQSILRVEIDVPYRFDVILEIPLKLQFPFEEETQTSVTEPLFDWD